MSIFKVLWWVIMAVQFCWTAWLIYHGYKQPLFVIGFVAGVLTCDFLSDLIKEFKKT